MFLGAEKGCIENDDWGIFETLGKVWKECPHLTQIIVPNEQIFFVAGLFLT